MDKDKRKVILEFRDLKALLDYTLLTETNNCEIIRSKFTLICELTEADIALAMQEYKAVVIE